MYKITEIMKRYFLCFSAEKNWKESSRIPRKHLTFDPGNDILMSVQMYRITTRAVRYSNGKPHKSCMRLSHSDGRAPTTQYKEIDNNGIQI